MVKCETTNTAIKIKVTFFTMNFQNLSQKVTLTMLMLMDEKSLILFEIRIYCRYAQCLWKMIHHFQIWYDSKFETY